MIDFSRSYAAGPSGFLVPKAGDLAKLPGTGEILSMGSDEAKAKPIIDGMRALLKGKSIGVQVATIQANFVHHYFDDVATVQEYKTAEQNDLDLMAGRLDTSFAEESVQLATLSKPDAKDLAIAGAEFRGGPDLGDGTGVGIRKERARAEGHVRSRHRGRDRRRLAEEAAGQVVQARHDAAELMVAVAW